MSDPRLACSVPKYIETYTLKERQVDFVRKNKVKRVALKTRSRKIGNSKKLMRNKEINFSDYAPLNKDYTREELAEVYKRIMLDIDADKKNKSRRKKY